MLVHLVQSYGAPENTLFMLATQYQGSEKKPPVLGGGLFVCFLRIQITSEHNMELSDRPQ